MKYIEKLQYITHEILDLSHIEQVQLACEAGAKWIQYRCLSKNEEELLNDINVIAEICDDWGTTLIVTNHIYLNGKADIQGFHIEDSNADSIALRKLVGDDITLGGSANNVEEVIRLTEQGFDYVCLGPFSAGATNTNSLNILGIDGYLNSINQLKDLNINIPVLAAGGIKIYDVEPLMQTGIFGIAVSESIYSADDFIQAYQDFYEAVKI
ncbi:thiamine phosphate synthase [Pedobacter sp. MC2016-05]|uniref:thiamine phosphate synthase n=1 Tax=Pedobacter sp. MC2016-05 TaxID=2994474 RepID=UPI0022466B5F|nr:thiamine phosphate synthase [Pedobacter sp. MC2016-05]MCX2475424.1 thiamine phosphate synthase [Pedobacter sp. MC2016-05]